MTTRYDVRFTGRVQGVGFRYSTVTVAERHRVHGWVRNEADGSVRCLVEGEPAEVERFIADIQRVMEGNIRDTNVAKTDATGEFEGFSVRY